MQQVYMPFLYRRYCGFGKGTREIQKGLVLFADSHTREGKIPFSMRRMYETVSSCPAYQVDTFITRFEDMGYGQMLRWIRGFMKQYAVAEYVFICDNFLPVSSCEKRPETTVVQLWHSGGILKKSGYDTADDIPKLYRGNVYKNYDLVTVSAPELIPIFTKLMGLPEGTVKATGISRSDWYFDEQWNRSMREQFYRRYPEAEGRQVILWAPTFRGNAGSPRLYGMDEIKRVMERTKERYFWLLKLHPHLEGKGFFSNCDIPTEELLCVTDLLITDYSSVLFDYMAYEKPFVFFAPDLESYEKTRGFYLPYDSYPTTVVTGEGELEDAIAHEFSNRASQDIREAYGFHMSCCDGHATERILSILDMCREDAG
ncbi:MAG: CDP-glycerol glycerophosphotransferase family protein [Lachnospiraceae bacterium]|nr:CDP-glycerol glycerophosphotransferase family protein [Lachnospiraceae bacterium]